MKKLKAYFENPSNVVDSLSAKQLYDKITEDYYNVTQRKSNSPEAVQNVPKDSTLKKNYGFIDIHIINNHFPTEPKEIVELNNIMKSIDNEFGDYDLNDISLNIFLLSSLAHVNFEPFEIDKINKWFINLIR